MRYSRFAPLILAITGHAYAAPEITLADQQLVRSTGSTLVSQLGAELKRELGTGGAESAIGVCRDAAPRIASELSRQSGMKVTRVSLKTRNPLLGTPDAWEQSALQDLDARAARGDKLETLETLEIVQEAGGRSLRYLKAIPVQTPCLACHGDPAQMSAGVKEKLAAAYPHDRATGYSLGLLRGAVSIKKPLN